MQKWKKLWTRSFVWREDDLAEPVEECDAVLKQDLLSQLVTLLFPALHMGSKHFLNSSGSVSSQICRDANVIVTGHRCKQIRGEGPTLRDH